MYFYLYFIHSSECLAWFIIAKEIVVGVSLLGFFCEIQSFKKITAVACSIYRGIFNSLFSSGRKLVIWPCRIQWRDPPRMVWEDNTTQLIYSDLQILGVEGVLQQFRIKMTKISFDRALGQILHESSTVPKKSPHAALNEVLFWTPHWACKIQRCDGVEISNANWPNWWWKAKWAGTIISLKYLRWGY